MEGVASRQVRPLPSPFFLHMSFAYTLFPQACRKTLLPFFFRSFESLHGFLDSTPTPFLLLCIISLHPHSLSLSLSVFCSLLLVSSLILSWDV